MRPGLSLLIALLAAAIASSCSKLQTVAHLTPEDSPSANPVSTPEVPIESPPSDVEPPSVPTALTLGSAKATEIVFQWIAATDDNEVARYHVFRNGVEVGTAVTSYYKDSGLIPQSSSTYTVTAEDRAGNLSGESAPLTATTRATNIIPLAGCGILNQAGATYVLQNDISSPYTCMILTAKDITLDLNGKTIAYDDTPRPSVPNGDFETGPDTQLDSWTASCSPLPCSPQFERVPGTYVGPPTLFSGAHSARLPVPSAADQLLTSSEIALAANTEYSITVMAYNMVSTNAAEAITLQLELEGTSSVASFPGRTWRGFMVRELRYTTGAAPESRRLILKVTGTASVPAGHFYVDDVRVQRYRPMGVAVGPTNYAPYDFPNLPAYGAASGAVIRNGTITQGPGEGNFGRAVAVGENSKWIEIAGLDIAVNGLNAKAVTHASAVYSSIHDNVISSDIHAITSRDNYDGALIHLGGLAYLIYNNTITSGIQTGIKADTNGTGAAASPVRIHNNNITLQTRVTNDFAIIGSGSMIYDNVINCGDGNNSCRGLFAGMNARGSRIFNNVVNVQQLPRNQEYGGCSLGGAYGIQLEHASDTEIHGNTVIAIADQCEAIAFRANPTNGALSGSNNRVHHNTFIARSLGTKMASAMKFSETPGESLDFYDNTVTTNDSWLFADANVVDVTLSRNRFTTAAPLASPFKPFPVNCYGGYPQNLTFLDNVFTSLSDRNAFYNATMHRYIDFARPFLPSYQQSWTLATQVTLPDGSPGAGALVTAFDSTGAQAAQATANGSGKATLSLIEVRDTTGIKTQFGPYRIQATLNGRASELTVTPTAPASIKIHLP